MIDLDDWIASLRAGAVATVCARDTQGYSWRGSPVAECDALCIAKLQAENERIKARLVGVLDYSRSLAAASAENADRLERELAEAHAMIADNVKTTMLEACAAYNAGLPLSLWDNPGPLTPELQAELAAATERLASLRLPPEMIAAWHEKARRRTAAFTRCHDELAEAKAGLAAYARAFGPLVVGAEPVQCMSCSRLIAELAECQRERDSDRADYDESRKILYKQACDFERERDEAKGRVGALEDGARHFAQCHRLCDGCSELARALLATHPTG